MNRRWLPVPTTPPQPAAAVGYRDQTERFRPVERICPPDGAPNVLVVLLGDMGFGPRRPTAVPAECPPQTGW